MLENLMGRKGWFLALPPFQTVTLLSAEGRGFVLVTDSVGLKNLSNNLPHKRPVPFKSYPSMGFKIPCLPS